MASPQLDAVICSHTHPHLLLTFLRSLKVFNRPFVLYTLRGSLPITTTLCIFFLSFSSLDFNVVFVVFLLHFLLDPGTTFLRTYISLISLFRWVALAASAFSFFEFVLYTFFFLHLSFVLLSLIGSDFPEVLFGFSLFRVCCFYSYYICSIDSL